MTVFKTYLKILKTYLPTILLYFGIFMFIAIMVGSFSSSSTTFKEVKPKILIIDNDNTLITKSFKNYAKKIGFLVNIKNDEDDIKDALFYRQVDFVITFDKNFYNDLKNKKNVTASSLSVPNSSTNLYTKMLLDKYFSLYITYLDANISEEKIPSLVMESLKENTKVTLLDNSKKDIDKLNYFYNYTNYTILSTSILIIGLIINTFNKINIKKRNIISSMSYKKLNRSLFLGNILLALTIWALYIVVSFILYFDLMFSKTGILFMLNSLSFSIMALSLGFLLGNLLKSREAQNGVVNIIALGSSFLCGAFVPQQFLSSSVVSISKILPSYWYITNNNNISSLSNYDFDSLSKTFIYMLVILLYSLLFFLMTNYVTKKKQKIN